MPHFVRVSNENVYLLKNMKDKNSVNILYGAGSTGRECLKIFEELHIKVDFFCDDDSTKCGKRLNGVEIIPTSELINIPKKINLVITSIYAKCIYKKLPQLTDMTIYEVFSLCNFPQGIAEELVNLSHQQRKELSEKFEAAGKVFKDQDSKETWKVITDAIMNQDTNIAQLDNIVSDEECYFIKEVLSAWKKDSIVLDGGSGTGEIVSAMKAVGISCGKIYCFEVEKNNFKTLCRNAKNNRDMICVQKALWSTDGEIYVEEAGSCTKIVDYQTENHLSAVSIDSYFGEIKIDFIKMDIEGAEQAALHGGIQVIKRDRPILAVSIYHSVGDLYEIPLFLHEILEEYDFYLRHHSVIFCETVLYCVPRTRR